MAGKNNDISAVYKIEQSIGQCEIVPILPAVVSRFLAQLAGMELTPATLAELIGADPALTILALQLCRKKGISINTGTGAGVSWIQQMFKTVTLREIRDAVLSARIYGGLEEDVRTGFRRELTRHSLSAACCAERLAQAASPALNGRASYLAGLLHDTGKFLLEEVMPKSFDALLEEARSGKSSFCLVERKNLGTDHTIIGKRFAQKLRLPGEVILGIWLHHEHTGALSEAVPQARIACVVELADCIVRRSGIGESGSYDEAAAETIDSITSRLGLTSEQIRRVEEELPEIVRQKSETAGLTILRPGWAYCNALREITSQLTAESARLSEESVRLQSNASHYDFVRELLPNVNSTTTAIEVAKQLAICWQRFYQTGPVCVYLVGQDAAKSIEAVIVENQAKTKTSVFEVPEDIVLIPQSSGNEFEVLDAGDYADWLLEQSEVEFDLGRTKLIPLQSAGRTVGVIIFELRHPAGSTSLAQGQGDISQRFAPAARLGAILLDLLESIRAEQWFAERFAEVLGAGSPADSQVSRHSGTGKAEAPATPRQAGKTDVEGLAEMAAGAAHELNNPLSVISGRAQLLANTETDPEKKRILGQIQQNAGELAAIIDDLMGYANPPAPKPTEMTIRQIIDEAIDLAGTKTPINRANIKIEISPDTPNVFVDSAQIDIAVSNIICNALESYDGQIGPLTIQASGDKTNSSVTIQISDTGRGMDEQTLVKAAQPFFSAKPAGRKRGMGLAHCQRLIHLNGGTLSIASQPGKGTTVTVALPANF